MDPLSPCLPLYEFTSPVADVVPRGSPMMCGPFPRHARLLSKREEGPGGGGRPCLRRAGRPWGDRPEPDGPSLGQPDPSLLTPGQGPACPPLWGGAFTINCPAGRPFGGCSWPAPCPARLSPQTPGVHGDGFTVSCWGDQWAATRGTQAGELQCSGRCFQVYSPGPRDGTERCRLPQGWSPGPPRPTGVGQSSAPRAAQGRARASGLSRLTPAVPGRFSIRKLINPRGRCRHQGRRLLKKKSSVPVVRAASRPPPSVYTKRTGRRNTLRYPAGTQPAEPRVGTPKDTSSPPNKLL